MTCFTCGSRVDVVNNKCPKHQNTDINGNERTEHMHDLVAASPETIMEQLKSAPVTPPVDSITLDTILTNVMMQKLPNGLGATTSHVRFEAKSAILAWHQKATTKELLALLPEKKTKDVRDYVNIGYNQAIDDTKANIQAREDNQ